MINDDGSIITMINDDYSIITMINDDDSFSQIFLEVPVP